ncbi:hypothetical protein V6N11_065130 [Hibiscus sabdariffa]|uniref:RNase H type-1 domain-containing protein n=1 Tax=Hibiscus sabdariffa TaxID=183260 RepID=A0ABR2SJY0_9ROSI
MDKDVVLVLKIKAGSTLVNPAASIADMVGSLGHWSKLLTNIERWYRHLTFDPQCVTYGAEHEDLDHIFRNCPGAFILWKSLIHDDFQHEFFSLPIKDWVFPNLTNARQFAIHGDRWDLLFGALTWNLWLQWNECIFEPLQVRCKYVLQHSLRMQRESIALSFVSGVNVPSQARVPRSAVSWIRPLAGWWICFAIEAELWGIYEGMLAVWSIGVRRLCIESDILYAIKALKSVAELQGHMSLVSYIVAAMSWSLEVKFEHVYREGNHLVDFFSSILSSG